MKLDNDKFQLHLAVERAERGLNLARVVKFDPKKHPRDYMGKFREVLGSLKPGDKVEVMTTRNDDGPDKLEVTYGRDVDTGEAIYEVNNGAPMGPTFKTAGRAARNAMRQSGRAGGTGNLPDTLEDNDGDAPGEEAPEMVTGNVSYMEGGVSLPDPKTDTEGYRGVVKDQVDEWIANWWDTAYEIAAEAGDEDFDFADMSDDFVSELDDELPVLIPGSKFDAKKMKLTLPNGDVFDIDSEAGANLWKGKK